MKLEERQRALLKLVQEYRERECRRVLDEAREQGRALLRQAYRRERAHLHDRVVAERSRARARIHAARAERATRERWVSERTSVELLAVAWPRLRASLLERWSDRERRHAWTIGCLRQGLKVLPRGLWTVRHAAEWGEGERGEAAAEIAAKLETEPRFETDGGIQAGLIIESGGAVLDASVEGLLRDRQRIEARLRALLEAEGVETREGPGDAGTRGGSPEGRTLDNTAEEGDS